MDDQNVVAGREMTRSANSPRAGDTVVPYRCPVSGEALLSDDGRLRSSVSGELYPTVGGIPVLLASRSERERAATTDWSRPPLSSGLALDFYNRPVDHDHYCRAELPELYDAIRRCYESMVDKGPSLEIGTGKGSLQGIGQDYCGLDYSLTALSRYVDSKWQRVCGSASALPFFDATFAFVYSVATLEHVIDPKAAFEEIDRILKPGGVVYLLPAWHCVQYNCEGIPVRPYRELSLRQKVTKLSLPIRRHLWLKAGAALPRRVARRLAWRFHRKPTALRYSALRPDYDHFWMSDSDAACRLDSHEGALFFQSRGYDLVSPGPGTIPQIFARAEPLVARRLPNLH